MSLRDVFSAELLDLCVSDTDLGPVGEFNGGPMRGGASEPPRRSEPSSGRLARHNTTAFGGVSEPGGAVSECATVPGVSLPVEGCSGPERTCGEWGGGSSTWMPNPIRRLRIVAHRTGAVASVLGNRKGTGPARIVGQAAKAAVARRIGDGSVGSGAPTVRRVG